MNNFEYISYQMGKDKIETKIPLKKSGIYYLSGQEKYWLFSAGKNQDLSESFVKKGILGLAWDKIKVEDILNSSEIELRTKIEDSYKNFKDKYRDEKGFRQYVSSVTTKLQRFVEKIKLGDIIVLKDKKNDRIIFGKVISQAYEGIDSELKIDDSLGYCNKIRKIKWIKAIDRKEAPTEIKLALTSRHALSGIKDNKVIDEINREVFSLFYRGDNLHIIFRVGRKEAIDSDKFIEFQTLISELKRDCLAENSVAKDNLKIKSNVQSPGPIEFFGDPEIVKYIFRAITMGGPLIESLELKNYLKITQPTVEINDGFSEGN